MYDYVSPVIECGVAVNTNVVKAPGAYEMRSDLGQRTGFVTVEFEGYNTPTRLQLEYRGNIVADSLFIGDVLPDATEEGIITSLSTLNTYNYNGYTYDLSNSESINYTAADIAVSDGSELRSSGDGTGQTGVVADFPSPTAKASDGSIKLEFLKDTALPTEMIIRVITANGANSWSMNGVTCPSPRIVPVYLSECSDTPLVTPDVAGFWNLETDVTTQTGAVVITMRPKNVTDTLGSVVEYNGVTYNTFVSNFDGTHKSDTDGNYTWVGATTPSSPQVRDEYTYDNGSFVDTGNDVSQVVAAGDVSTSSFPVGSTTRPYYTIVIPKIETNIETIDFKLFGDTETDMTIRCPKLLNSSQVDGPYEFPNTAINPPGLVFRDFFTVHKSGIGTSLPFYVPISDDPILHCEQLFLDANGIQTLQKGYYYTNDIETPPEFTNQDQYKIIYVDDWGTAYYYTPEEISEGPIECSDGMDVAFIMDYTGSMTDEIDTLKAGFTSLINTIDNQSGANNYRIAIVTADERGAGLPVVPTYNDCSEYTSLPAAQKLNYAGGNDHQLFITAWEMFQDNNGASATTAVDNLNGGGFCIQMGDGTGSGPECTDQAIGRVLNDNFVNAWRPNVAKYIIVGTDVLPGGDDGSFDETDWVFIQSLVATAVSEGVKIFVLGSGVDIPYQTQAGPYVYPWRYLATETGGDWDNSFETTTINSQIIASCNAIQQP